MVHCSFDGFLNLLLVSLSTTDIGGLFTFHFENYSPVEVDESRQNCNTGPTCGKALNTLPQLKN